MPKLLTWVLDWGSWIFNFLSPRFGMLLIGMAFVRFTDIGMQGFVAFLILGVVLGIYFVEWVRKKDGCFHFLSRNTGYTKK